jgi:lipopolysaccharide transport system ATP-binding protein
MAFQKKCLGKMEKVAQEGRTVLFVSHNMGTIKAMCKKALFINNGEMAYFGGVDAAIDNYLSTIETRSGSEAQADINPSRSIQILSASIMDMEGKPTSVIGHDEPFTIRIQVAVNKPMYKTAVGLLIHNRDFETILASYDFEQMDDVLLTRQPGHYSFQVHVPATLLVPGNYRISVIINKSDRKKKIIHSLDHVCPFEIFDNGSIYARSNYNWQGVIHIPLQWETEVVFMRD